MVQNPQIMNFNRVWNHYFRKHQKKHIFGNNLLFHSFPKNIIGLVSMDVSPKQIIHFGGKTTKHGCNFNKPIFCFTPSADVTHPSFLSQVLGQRGNPWRPEVRNLNFRDKTDSDDLKKCWDPAEKQMKEYLGPKKGGGLKHFLFTPRSLGK